jgi:hypothetical protein
MILRSMKQLPADLADPLHILSPIPWQTLAWLALAALLAALWLLWRKLRRRRLPATAPPPANAKPPRRGTGIRATIDAIQQRYIDVDPRDGCHQLSAALRSHYETVSGKRLSTATVREILAAIGDGAVPRLFGLLADLQFDREEPTRSDFRGACEVARDVVATKGALKT